jgi:hypothetical protein
MDWHGNMTKREKPTKEKVEGGLKETGTYVLRDGQLVAGKAEVREKASFSNWYCSNADPEDIRKHRELMDRMNFKGPVWENRDRPKSVMEEVNPVYKKVEAEQHPSIAHPDDFGAKEFENVVR